MHFTCSRVLGLWVKYDLSSCNQTQRGSKLVRREKKQVELSYLFCVGFDKWKSRKWKLKKLNKLQHSVMLFNTTCCWLTRGSPESKNQNKKQTVLLFRHILSDSSFSYCINLILVNSTTMPHHRDLNFPPWVHDCGDSL